MLCVYITDNGRQLLYNQSIIIGLLYQLPEIMQIARKGTLVKRKRDNGVTTFNDVRQRLGYSYISDIRFDMRRPGSSLKLELHLCALDYTKYPLQELKSCTSICLVRQPFFATKLRRKENF